MELVSRVQQIDDHVTTLRVEQATLKSELASTTEAMKNLEKAVKELTTAMNIHAGERKGERAAYATIGAILGAVATVFVGWFTRK